MGTAPSFHFAYWAMVDQIDMQVARVLDLIERTGQKENTIIIFTSDHGEMLGDHGIYLKGPYFYDEGVRVPLIVCGPGVFRGRRVPALVEAMDLAPTILDMAGVVHPAGMQARSLWPILSGEVPGETHRTSVYSEYYNAMPFHQDPKAHATMVRDEKAKLVLVHGTDEGELYDLETDPGEQANLFGDPTAVGLQTRMLRLMCDRMAWTVDPLPVKQSSSLLLGPPS